MDRDQHIIQDASEAYSVFVLQKSAEELGRSSGSLSELLYEEFREYLTSKGLELEQFQRGEYAKYKKNADNQLPAFVGRLSQKFPSSDFVFMNVEKAYRDRGLKGDFTIDMGGELAPISVSLKNYIGSGGIDRPQVMSGTFASFAQSFLFERVGVGKFLDPSTGSTFQGSDVQRRESVLAGMGLKNVIPHLRVLDSCQEAVRSEFLSDEGRFYDRERLRSAAKAVAERGIPATLQIFDIVGIERVRSIILSRAGFDGAEEALYFDADQCLDSLTNVRYHELRSSLADPSTQFRAAEHGQAIRFEFMKADRLLLSVHVPFTINSNGAWYRPRERYQGRRTYIDKGLAVDLVWGERRPRKSKEIATSVNTYVELKKTGVFA